MYNPKDLKPIKEIVDWLNEQFEDSEGKKFLAYFEKDCPLQRWHIACVDYWLYKEDEYNDCVAAIREGYPKLKITFCALNWLGDWVMKKRKETQQGKAVIIIR